MRRGERAHAHGHIPDRQAKLRSYELIARAYQLPGVGRNPLNVVFDRASPPTGRVRRAARKNVVEATIAPGQR